MLSGAIERAIGGKCIKTWIFKIPYYFCEPWFKSYNTTVTDFNKYVDAGI